MSDSNYNDGLILRELSKLENMTYDVKNTVDHMGAQMDNMNKNINHVSNELNKLATDFKKMMEEQRKTAALQQATTELVRIRQELEQNYGGYMVVRETMLGVLQATDSALVKKTTIARVSEELMISTPEYWLAPCLVAVSAWISNDRDLAERAIIEAVKRDEERTALCMALICRRNNRVQTCYEWLSIYFAKQQATQITESSYAYIDAYVNGIFGPDDKHMCDDYIARWIDEIRGSNSVFESEQETMWKDYCGTFKCTVDSQYPALKQNVAEYDRIDGYLGRVNSVEAIKDNFKKIADAYVDQEYLKTIIDKKLIELISRYDDKEEPLRKEEELQMAIKAFGGDVEKAKKHVIQKAESKKEQRLNLVEQMSNAIRTDKNVLPSKRKTAVSFLSGYIKKGFESYVNQEKDKFPTGITMNINGWTGSTVDGSNINELYSSYGQYMQQCYNQELEKVTNRIPNLSMIGGIVSAVLMIIFLIVSWPIGIIFGIGFVACFAIMISAKVNMKNNIANVGEKYQTLSAQGNKQIADCVEQWKHARNVAQQFSSQPTPELIA